MYVMCLKLKTVLPHNIHAQLTIWFQGGLPVLERQFKVCPLLCFDPSLLVLQSCLCAIRTKMQYLTTMEKDVTIACCNRKQSGVQYILAVPINNIL